MSIKLTKKLIDGFKHEEESKKDIRWDADISGFGLRIYPSGKKSFILSYRQDGKKRLYTIGQYGNITLEQARVLARKKLGEVADGKDPVTIRKDRRKKHKWTVKTAFNDFLNKYAKVHNSTWEETQRIFEKDVLPILGRKPIDEVQKDDILKILDKVVERKSGVMANRTLAAMRKFFNWCVERNLIKHSPAYKISAPAKNTSRDRVLSDQELALIWKAADKCGYPFGRLVQFLILTGQRRGEVSNVLWAHFNKEEKLWVLPREDTKSNRQHDVPLSDMAIEVLETCPLLGDYVFTSSGKRPFDNFSRGKKALETEIKKLQGPLKIFPKWTLHDLRRTTASGMARLKVAPHIIEKVLNHSTGQISGVAAVYNRYEYAEEKRDALEKWAKYLDDLLIK